MFKVSVSKALKQAGNQGEPVHSVNIT